jgi:hypothetical protein
MDNSETQQIVRELLVEADALSRAMYAEHNDTIAWRLAALRTTLQRIDRRLGGAEPSFGIVGELDMAYHRILDVAAMARSVKLSHLVANAARLRAQAHPDERPRVVQKAPEVPALAARYGAREWVPAAVGLVALGVTLVARPLRRSALAWGIVAGLVGVSLARFRLEMSKRPTRFAARRASLRVAPPAVRSSATVAHG